MKVTLPFIAQIRGSAQENTQASDTDLASRAGWIAETFQQQTAAITTGYHSEHHDDDRHKDIHCDSIAERGRTTPMGEWITAQTADATAFQGSGSMTWTVSIADQANVSYALIGKTMVLTVRLDSTSVGGVLSNTLRMRIPGGFIAARQAAVPCLATDNATAFNTLCFMRVTAGSEWLEFLRFDVANWQASSNSTYVQAAQIAFEVQ